MNRKKMSSLILACVILSSTIPQHVTFADITNSTVLNNIIASNAENKSFTNISNYSINRYIISTTNSSDTASVVQAIKDNPQLRSDVDVISVENSDIIINLANSKSSLTDTIKTLSNVTEIIQDKNYIPNIQEATQNDFATNFYIYNNSKYIKVNSFNSNSIIPTINLTSDTLSNAKYLDCKLVTTNNSSQQSVQCFRFGNLSEGDYALPSIKTENLKSIAVEYNIVDSFGNTLKKAKQSISSDVSSPVLTIKNASLNLQSEDSTLLSLTIKATGENSNDLLNHPVIYLNDNEISYASTGYDSSSGLYTVALNIPSSTSTWNLQVFASDDALNLSNVTLSSDSLLKFNNTKGNTIYSGSSNVISGMLPSNGNIKSLKINNADVQTSDNNFSYDNSAKSPINATYIYGQDNIPINYTANFALYTQGPVFNNVVVDSNNVTNNSTINLTSNKLNLTGTITSSINTILSIDSIKYIYNNEDPIDVPYSFVNGNLNINNFALPNNDEGKTGKLTITAHDALNNKSNFCFSLYSASGVAAPQTALNSSVSPLKSSTFDCFKGAVTPSVDTGFNPLIDFVSSHFTLSRYVDSSLKSLINSVVYDLKDINLQNLGSIFSFKTPLEDGVYLLTTTLYDIGGNSSSTANQFIVDTAPPEINITNKNSTLNQQNYSRSNTVVEDVNVYDTNFKSANAKISKDNIPQQSEDLNNNTLKEYSFSGDGTYSIHISANDAAGNESIKDSKFVIDTTAPVASFNNITNNKDYTTLIAPKVNVVEKNIDNSASYFDVKEDNDDTKRYYFTDKNVISNDNNTQYTLANVVNEDGAYNVTVHISDLAGNVLSKDLTSTFYEETSDITPVISGVTDGEKTQNTVTPTIQINDKFFNKDDIGQDKAINATLNGKPYNLKFDSKNDNTITLIGDPISENSPRGQQYNLVVSDVSKYDPNITKTTTVNFVIDNEAPVISFRDANNRNIENGKYYNKVINPVINLSDNYNISNYSVTINGNNYNGNISKDNDGNITFIGDPITSDGNYLISVIATDEAGNQSNYSTSFTLDNTLPYINITGVLNNEYTNNLSVTPDIQIDDTNLDSSKIYFNLSKNGVVLPVNPMSINDLYKFSLYDEGNYSLSVTAIDKAGNVFTTSPINFTIDRTSPILNINFKDGSYINKFFRPSITTENPDDFINELIINGISYNSDNLPLLNADGTYEIIAQGKDKAGNLSPLSTYHFTVDTTPPLISVENLIANFYYNRNVGPNITSSDVNPSSFTMTLNGQPYNNEPINAEGNYELVITSIDKAGNENKQVIDFVIDKTAPTITIKGIINNETLRSILTPLIGIDDPNAQVTILLDGEDYHGGPISTDGKHTLIIEAMDKSGNISKKTITFFLKATPPSIYVSGLENGDSYKRSVTPDISFSKDVVPEDTIMTLDGKAYKQGDEISSTGEHELSISVQDSVGNKTTKDIKFTITSTNIIASTVPKLLHKVLPAKIANSKKNIIVLFICVLAVIIGALGIVRLKIKNSKLRWHKENIQK